jgi:hypothetical protein
MFCRTIIAKRSEKVKRRSEKISNGEEKIVSKTFTLQKIAFVAKNAWLNSNRLTNVFG